MRKFQQTCKKYLVLTGASLILGAGSVGHNALAAESAAEPSQAVMRLPVSLNTVMVAMINQAADPLWVAAWHQPKTDKEWRELERRAVQLELGGALLSVPGTGPLDDRWTSDEDWKMWADKLRAVGAGAVVAVKARDLKKISLVGDKIVEICEGCHLEFKPALPTGGEFGELSPHADDLKDK
ncbi:MAG: hypothetical protein DRR06_14955 [Gammaproteobacteria bacterium]|nr:MAG: hypothetical protein DRR06_14955 [Gammaproteobacteria bacterium]